MHLTRELMLKQAVKGPLAIVRLSQIYGVGDTHNAYGPNRMIRSARRENKILLFGDGEETRDHLFIDDLVNMVVVILRRKSLGHINLASGTSVSFAELAEIIADLFPTPVEIASVDRRVPITHRRFDTSALRAFFPTVHTTTIEQGIGQMNLTMIDQGDEVSSSSAVSHTTQSNGSTTIIR
jgi:nucleoside-diphosphate-sugar epimerase